MKPTPCSSERITNQELLLSGWHGIWTGGKQYWAHPELSHNTVRFHDAARIEKAFRELKKRVSNKQGDGKP